MSTEQMQVIRMSDLMDAGGRFFGFARRQSLKGVGIVAFCMLVAVGYFFYQKPAYTANVSFILEEKSSSVGGGLSSIASQFGLDISGMNGGSGMFAGDNILDILKSRSIVEKVLLSKVDSSKGANGITLVDLYLNFSGLRKKWANTSASLEYLSFHQLGANSRHSTTQDSVLYVVYERLFKKHINAERLNKKGSIITVTTVSADQTFSKLFAERLLDETRKLYISVKTGIAAANVLRLEARADSLLRVINNKSYQSASQQLLDANAAFKTAIVPAEVSQRDRTVAYAIYTEVMKNLEASRMTVAGQTPVIQVLDAPRYPLEDQRKSLTLLLVVGLVGGLVISGLLVFFFYPKREEA